LRTAFTPLAISRNATAQRAERGQHHHRDQHHLGGDRVGPPEFHRQREGREGDGESEQDGVGEAAAVAHHSDREQQEDQGCRGVDEQIPPRRQHP